jgi:prepilin-type processing-associated H-X9-DG protein
MSTSGSDNCVLLARLADEFAARYRRGERPSLTEYVERYPHLAADICEVFPALVEVEQVKEEDHHETAGGLLRGHPGNYCDAQRNLLPASKSMDSRGQTFTTIRYLINQKTGWILGTRYVGVGLGRAGEEANVPLVSAHSGGVNALFGDGSVRFLSDGTDILTLARLATRDDGAVVTLP